MNIIKPNFMKFGSENDNKHGLFFYIMLALLGYIIVSFLSIIFELPVLLSYLFSNSEYVQMLQNGNPDYKEMYDIIDKYMKTNLDSRNIALLFSNMLMIIFAIFVAKKIDKRSLQTMGFNTKKLPAGILQGLIVGVIFVGVVISLQKMFGFKWTVTGSDKIGIIVLYGVGFLVQGFSEEIFCKGFLMVSLSKNKSIRMSAIYTSIFFTLLHMGNPNFGFLAIVNLFMYSYFTCMLFVDCENIWTLGVIHFIWNFATSCIYGLNVSGMSGFTSLMSVETYPSEKYDIFCIGGGFGPEGTLIFSFVLYTAMMVLNRHMIFRNKFESLWTDREVEYLKKIEKDGYQIKLGDLNKDFVEKLEKDRDSYKEVEGRDDITDDPEKQPTPRDFLNRINNPENNPSLDQNTNNKGAKNPLLKEDDPHNVDASRDKSAKTITAFSKEYFDE